MQRLAHTFLIIFLLPAITTCQSFWERLEGPPAEMGGISKVTLLGNDTLFALLGSGVGVSFDHGVTWQRRTLGQTSTIGMAMDSTGTLMLISHYDGVFRSSDAGHHWERVNDGIVAPPNAYYRFELWDICYNQAEDAWYIASINSSVLRSSDAGRSWTTITIDSLDAGFSSITATQNGNIVVCGDKGVYTWFRDRSEWHRTGTEGQYLHNAGSRIYATVAWGGYLLSTDNGESWQLRDGVSGLVVSDIFDLGVHGVFLGGSTMLQYGQTYHSVDSGRTWTLIQELSEYANRILTMVALPSGDLIVGMQRGMLRSDTSAHSWTPINTGLGRVTVIDVMRTETDHIFTGSREGVHKFDTRQATWSHVLKRHFVKVLHQHSQGVMFARAWPGILRSYDNGGQWDSLILGYNQMSFIVEDGAGVLYCGVVDSLVFKSFDAGTTWSAGVMQVPKSVVVAAGASAGSIFILLKDYGLFRFDSTLSFYEILLPAAVIGESYSLSITSGGTLFASGRNGLFRSSDNGGNWERIRDPEARTCLPVLIETDLNETLYCLFKMYDGQVNYSKRPDNLLYKTTDNGVSWHLMELPQPFQQFSCLKILNDGKLYIASVSEGLFRSRDVVSTTEFVPSRASENHEITIWPHPARTWITLAWPKTAHIHTVIIHDGLGRIVSRREVESQASTGSFIFDVSGFRSGVYAFSLVGNAWMFRKNFLVLNDR